MGLIFSSIAFSTLVASPVESLATSLRDARALTRACENETSKSEPWFESVCPIKNFIFPELDRHERQRKSTRWAHFTTLQQEPLDRIISLVSRQDFERLKAQAPAFLAHSVCPRNLSLATARVLERELNDPPTTELIRKLLRHADGCMVPSDPVYTSSKLRMALFEILWGKPEEARALLESFTPTPDQPDYARALFWKGLFERRQSALPPSWLKLLSDRPSTFHAFIANHKLNRSPKDLLSRNRFEASLLDAERDNPKAFHFWVQKLLQQQTPGLAERLAFGALRAGHLRNSAPLSALLVQYFREHQADGSRVRLAGQIALENPKFFTESLMKDMFPPSFRKDFQKLRTKIDPHILMAVARQESAFDARAVSPVGAVGLLQIMPRTARSFAGASRSELFHPPRNIEIGSQYLENLVERFNDLELALAGYNAGRERVAKWASLYGGETPDLLFLDLIPFRETRDYVANILRNYYWYNFLYQPQERPGQRLTAQTSYVFRNLSEPSRLLRDSHLYRASR